MPFDREFATVLMNSMAENGWQVVSFEESLPNPLRFDIVQGNQSQSLRIYARRLTQQQSETSTHNRPRGEMHMQMIFDDTHRGAGIRNYLQFSDGVQTLLFGYYQINNHYVVAAYDPERHREYAYSKSLQVKLRTLEEASRTGIALQARTTGEIIVAFHMDQFFQYLELAHEWHHLNVDAIGVAQENTIKEIQSVFTPGDDTPLPPALAAKERTQRTQEITQYVRSYRFTQGIKLIYVRCAICGFQYDDVLDAAHIVPVAAGGTDTYDNGLGLCPNCHRMFDRGLVLVNHKGRIFINPHLAEIYQQADRADSLDDLRQTLREKLWLPDDLRYYPSAENLQRTFDARNKPKPDF